MSKIFVIEGTDGSGKQTQVERLCKRLEKEKLTYENEIKRVEKMLSNEGFVAKAPAAVVDGEKAKLIKYRENLEGVVAALSKLK